jgi:hypothetical protein
MKISKIYDKTAIFETEFLKFPEEILKVQPDQISETKIQKSSELLSFEEEAKIRNWITENIKELEFWNAIFQDKKQIIEKELVKLMLMKQNLELNSKNTMLMLSRIFKSEYKSILLKDNHYNRNYFRNYKYF